MVVNYAVPRVERTQTLTFRRKAHFFQRPFPRSYMSLNNTLQTYVRTLAVPQDLQQSVFQTQKESLQWSDLAAVCSGPELGQQIYDLIAALYPIQRSITGEGVRQSLRILQRYIPVEIHEVPSGTEVLDWTIPKEWNIRDAYVKNARGERVIDYKNSCLHVLGYSVPVHGRFSLSELKEHLYTAPKYPGWIPFRYSYYTENWGFCLSQNDFDKLEDGEYEVMIDSTLEDGSLTYGEYYLAGQSSDEVLVCVHIDHPAMCNDNLSGVSVATFLAERLSRVENRRLSYRFLFIPTTIGSISWLAGNEDKLDRIIGGFTMNCIGDDHDFTWKETRRGNTAIDRAMKCALRETGETFEVKEFIPFGFDERQFGSPGFNLPIGCIYRSHAHHYPENHTSADDLNLMKPDKLAGALALCAKVATILEGDGCYWNTSPKAEPQLGKRGIYRTIGGPIPQQNLMHLFWMLNFSDGEHSILDTAERSKFNFADLRAAADILLECGLLVPYSPDCELV
jgi:aminopeptidase-like protein